VIANVYRDYINFCSFRALLIKHRIDCEQLAVTLMSCHSSFQMTLNCCVMFAGSKDLQQYVACSIYDRHSRNNEPWT